MRASGLLWTALGLARDAKDLKAENGWYGDPAQGTTTEAEDDEALGLLRALVSPPRTCDAEHSGERCQGCAENWWAWAMRDAAKSAMHPGRLDRPFAEAAARFWGAAIDGDTDLAAAALRDMHRLSNDAWDGGGKR
jgi:hypothetical protein